VNSADVAEYFPYPRVVNFLFEFCETLFGISVKVRVIIVATLFHILLECDDTDLTESCVGVG